MERGTDRKLYLCTIKHYVDVYRLAYPVYLLQKFKQDMGSQPLMLLYDIACLLETHLKVCLHAI